MNGCWKMFKRGKYIGSDPLLQGKTALVITVGKKAPRGIVPEGKVMIQAADVSTGYGDGWHAFPATDWDIREFTL